MKVSKIIMASLLGAVAINSVMADEYDGPRNRCKAQKDKVWVERDKRCIPSDPCTVEVVLTQKDIFDTYCFGTTMGYPEGVQAYDYIENMLKVFYNIKGKTIVSLSKRGEGGTFCVTLSDGEYKCFPTGWDNLNNYYNCDAVALADVVNFLFYDTSLMTKNYSPNDLKWSRCKELMQVKDDDPKVCEQIANMAAEVGNQTCTGVMVTDEFWGGMDLCLINCKK